MFRRRLFGETIGCFLIVLIAELLCGCSVAKAPEQELLTAAGKPAEGPLGVFLGKPVFDRQVVFEGDKVREPYLAISVDGTLLAVRTEDKQLRRSEDGGKSWGEIIDVSIAMLDSNMIVDEKDRRHHVCANVERRRQGIPQHRRRQDMDGEADNDQTRRAVGTAREDGLEAASQQGSAEPERHLLPGGQCN